MYEYRYTRKRTCPTRRHADLVICLGTSLQIEPSALLPATCLLRSPPSATHAAARPFAALSRTLRNWSRDCERQLKRRRKEAASSAASAIANANRSRSHSPTRDDSTGRLPATSSGSASSVAHASLNGMKSQSQVPISDSAPKLELPSASAFEAEADSQPNTNETSAQAITARTPTPTSEQKQEPRKANGERERERHLVIVNLQETAFDAQCSVRLFARIETVLALLLAALLPSAPPPPAPTPVAACAVDAVGASGAIGAHVSMPSASTKACVADGGGSDNGCAADWHSALRLDEAALARLASGHERTQCAVCAGEEAALAARHLPATVTRFFK